MCTMCENNSINEEEKSKLMNQDTFDKVTFDTLPFGLGLNDTYGNAKDFFIDDKLAFEIGSAILKKVYGEDKLLDYRFFVIEGLREGVFVVTALPHDRRMFGGEYSVAISKEDGKILSVQV